MTPLGSNRDRHAILGEGELGEKRLRGVPVRAAVREAAVRARDRARRRRPERRGRRARVQAAQARRRRRAGARRGREAVARRPSDRERAHERAQLRDALVDFRDHRRPGAQDDVPLAVPPRAARAAGLPRDRRRGRGLDRRPAARARPRVDRGDRREDRRAGVRALRATGCPTSAATSATSRPTSASPTALGDEQDPVFYLEIPPSLFATVVEGLARRGWCRKAQRVVVEKPFGHDLDVGPRAGGRPAPLSSTSRSCTASTTSSGRWASRRSSTCGSPTRCSSRSGTATTSPACRSRWPRASGSRTAATSTIRSARCATSSSTT